MKASQNLSFSEDSDLSFDDVLERSSQKSKPSVSNGPLFFFQSPRLIDLKVPPGLGASPHRPFFFLHSMIIVFVSE